MVAILTDNDYQKSINDWKWLKNKLNEEESELVSKTNQLKLKSSDGKYYNTDVTDIEGMFRIKSIFSLSKVSLHKIEI